MPSSPGAFPDFICLIASFTSVIKGMMAWVQAFVGVAVQDERAPPYPPFSALQYEMKYPSYSKCPLELHLTSESPVIFKPKCFISSTRVCRSVHTVLWLRLLVHVAGIFCSQLQGNKSYSEALCLRAFRLHPLPAIQDFTQDIPSE
ncbi:hypothetical protein RRG08_006085 [Elysia crispata]|uniref:Uncharacterized protein n=1 Tax=Elysia crispata TaxID=231223 RepID=A0AAE1CSL5_9GAST|nr:hypothetical protein RRG08_006085 [Elysia crispata]